MTLSLLWNIKVHLKKCLYHLLSSQLVDVFFTFCFFVDCFASQFCPYCFGLHYDCPTIWRVSQSDPDSVDVWNAVYLHQVRVVLRIWPIVCMFSWEMWLKSLLFFCVSVMSSHHIQRWATSYRHCWRSLAWEHAACQISLWSELFYFFCTPWRQISVCNVILCWSRLV